MPSIHRSVGNIYCFNVRFSVRVPNVASTNNKRLLSRLLKTTRSSTSRIEGVDFITRLFCSVSFGYGWMEEGWIDGWLLRMNCQLYLVLLKEILESIPTDTNTISDFKEYLFYYKFFLTENDASPQNHV